MTLTYESFGVKVSNVIAGIERRRFAVHEDLLCENSDYFANIMQRTRKPVTGECTICVQNLEGVSVDLSWCHCCGKNFHTHCIDRWVIYSSTGQGSCPLCRQPWPRELVNDSFFVPQLRSTCFEKYMGWLYTKNLAFNEVECHNDCEFVIETYLLSMQVKDWKFGTAVLHELIDIYAEKQVYPDQWAIALAYEYEYDAKDFPATMRLREFLVKTYVLNAAPDWFDGNHEYPADFERAVTKAMFEKHSKKSTKWSANTWKTEIERNERMMLEIERDERMMLEM